MECEDLGKDKERMTFIVATRGLIGLRSQLMNDTKGSAVLSNSFLKFGPHKGSLKKTFRGAIVATAEGIVTNFALKESEKFGNLFVT